MLGFVRDSKVSLAVGALVLFGAGFGLGWMVRGERSGGGQLEAASEPAPGDEADVMATSTSGPVSDGGGADASADGAGPSVAAARAASGAEGSVAVVGALDPDARMARGSAPGDSAGGEATTRPSLDGGAGGGALEANDIRDVMREHHEEFGFCFAWQLHTHPDLGGRLTMEFEIGPDGGVTGARIIDDALGDETVSRCFVNVTRRMEFPAGPREGPVVVRYPFILSPGDDADE